MSLTICGDCGKEIGLTQRCPHQPAPFIEPTGTTRPEPVELSESDDGEPIMPLDEREIDRFFPTNFTA